MDATDKKYDGLEIPSPEKKMDRYDLDTPKIDLDYDKNVGKGGIERRVQHFKLKPNAKGIMATEAEMKAHIFKVAEMQAVKVGWEIDFDYPLKITKEKTGIWNCLVVLKKNLYFRVIDKYKGVKGEINVK